MQDISNSIRKAMNMSTGRSVKSATTKWPDIVGDVRVNLAKVYSKIDSSAGANACWTWSGPTHRQGYGMIGGQRIATQTKIMMTVHRLLLKEKLGRDPGAAVDAMHTCGNMQCVNPAHIVPGTAREILELRVQRSGRRPGKPVGYRHFKPRNQKYAYGIENIAALAKNEISVEEFAKLSNVNLKRAQRIKHFIDAGQAYTWAKNYQGNQK
jgi:hypothetical protein